MSWLRNIAAALLAGLIGIAAIWAARRGQDEAKQAAKERDLARASDSHSDDAAKHRARAAHHEKNAQEAAETARRRKAKLDAEVEATEFMRRWGDS